MGASADTEQLHKFGYAQQLFRDMGGFANFALSFSIISILTGAITLYDWGLKYGGPFEMTVGWPLVTLFTLPVAASLAQLASAYPTAGALYHWSSMLGGPGWGWLTAWLNTVGQFAITAGVDYGLATFIADLAGTDSRAALFAIYAALLVSHGVLNHIGIRVVAWLNNFSAWYHMAGVVVMVGALVLWAPRQPLDFLLERATAGDRVMPYSLAFLVGLLQAQWTYTGYDASAHISEETRDPSRNGPWGIFLSVAVSGIFGYALLLAVTLAIPDLGAAMQAKNPFIYALTASLGPALGNALVWLALVAMWFCGLSSVTSNSRMIFAFARDGGLGRSKWLAVVSPRFRTPHRAVWISVAGALLVAAFGLGLELAGWSGAYGVIVSISTIGLYASYGIPIAVGMRARRTGRWNERGPWDLGRFSPAVNAVALLWTAFITVLFVMPPNAATGYLFAGVLALLAAWYFASVRFWFKGPRQMGTEEDMMKLEAELAASSVYHERAG